MHTGAFAAAGQRLADTDDSFSSAPRGILIGQIPQILRAKKFDGTRGGQRLDIWLEEIDKAIIVNPQTGPSRGVDFGGSEARAATRFALSGHLQASWSNKVCSDPAVCKDANRELFSCFSLSFCTRRLDVRGPLSPFCVLAVCKATVAGALSRPRWSAARTPSQTLSYLL